MVSVKPDDSRAKGFPLKKMVAVTQKKDILVAQSDAVFQISGDHPWWFIHTEALTIQL